MINKLDKLILENRRLEDIKAFKECYLVSLKAFLQYGQERFKQHAECFADLIKTY